MKWKTTIKSQKTQRLEVRNRQTSTTIVKNKQHQATNIPKRRMFPKKKKLKKKKTTKQTNKKGRENRKRQETRKDTKGISIDPRSFVFFFVFFLQHAMKTRVMNPKALILNRHWTISYAGFWNSICFATKNQLIHTISSR